MKELKLGNEGKSNKYKAYYLGLIVVNFMFLFWAWIGNISARPVIQFYMMFGLFALFFILFDNATGKKKDYIDTVTIEQPRTGLLSPKNCAILALILGGLIVFNIFRTGTAWVNYPTFQLFDNKYLNAALSGSLGVVENWVFFAFLFPTLYKLFSKRAGTVPGFLFSMGFNTLIFSTFHIFVYGFMPAALFSTVVFSLFLEISIFATRNMLIADSLHFFNNFAAFLVNAGVGLVISL